MRAAALAMLVLGCLSVRAADGKEPIIRDRPTRQTWQWTIEDRLAERFAPASMVERRSPQTLKELGIEQVPAADERQAVTTTAAARQTVNIIDGSRNPELFLPWELFNHLIVTTSLPDQAAREYCQRNYSARAASIDVPQDFWKRLEQLTGRFRSILDEKRMLEATLNAGADQAPTIERLEQIEIEICSARAEALQAARIEFGHDWFNRFLYTALTPSITIRATDETPDEHRRMERGCR